MKICRRSFVKKVASCGTLVGIGALMPRLVLADWPEAAFNAEDQNSAIEILFKDEEDYEESVDVMLKAPDFVDDGEVVPVTVSTNLEGVERISIFVDKNPSPLVCDMNIPEGTQAYLATRVRMAQTAKVTAVVKVGEELFSQSKTIEVNVGSCSV